MANVHGEGGSPLRLLEIAEAAGVSQATVSRVLNNKSGVAEATRQSVLTAVDVLGYSRPSNLQRAGTGAIGLVVPELDNPIFPALAQAVTTRLAAEGYTAVLCPTSAGGVQEDEYLSMLLERGVAGIVQVSGRHADTTASVARQREMLEAGLPLVLINGHREDLPAPSLSTDDGAAIHLAVEHLRRLGHDRIGLAVGPARYIPSSARRRPSVRSRPPRLSRRSSSTRGSRWKAVNWRLVGSSRAGSARSSAVRTSWRWVPSERHASRVSTSPVTCRSSATTVR